MINITPVRTPSILFVDDELPVLKSLKRLALDESWSVFCANSAEEGLAVLQQQPVNVVVSDMRMPGMDGAEFLTRVRNEQPDTERILITGYADVHALEKVVNEAKIFNYISKPWDDQVLTRVIQGALDFQSAQKEQKRLEKLTAAQNKKLGRLALCLDGKVKEKTIEVAQALSLLSIEHQQAQSRAKGLLRAVSSLIELSGKGDGHSHFVENIAVATGERLCLPPTETENLQLASQLHNIGSLAIADYWAYRVVSEMDTNELKRYRAQVEIGETVLSGLPELAPVADIVGKHKEHLDGSGYPRGLTAQDIPLAARIMCVVTEYVLLYEGRLEEGIIGHRAARAYMQNLSGETYDPQVLTEFFNLVHADSLKRDSTILSKDQFQLVPGTVLAADIFSLHNALLLKAGTTLTATHIEKLRVYEKSTGDKLEIRINRPLS